MNKLNIFKLIRIGILIFLVCFGISYSANKIFNLDSDFLSATATFFAAVVAFSLFNDWRQQYKAEMIERLKDRLHSLFNKLESSYNQLSLSVEVNQSKNDNYILKMNLLVGAVIDDIDSLKTELDFYEKIILKYKLTKLVNTYPRTVNDQLHAIGAKLVCSDIKLVADLDQYMNRLEKYLFDTDDYSLVINYKREINDDLQKVLLGLIDEQKGH